MVAFRASQDQLFMRLRCFHICLKQRECQVQVITAERTFWEKATILHQEAHRPEDSPQPSRYSRHYYDLAKMARSSVKDLALADTELLTSVVGIQTTFLSERMGKI